MLRERFDLRTHMEVRQVPVYALTLKEPGTLGRAALKALRKPALEKAVEEAELTAERITQEVAWLAFVGT